MATAAHGEDMPQDLSIGNAPAAAPESCRAERGARLRGLHEASLRLAAPTPAEAGAVAELLGEIVDRAVASVGGRDGRLVLADDEAWRDLVPKPAHGDEGLIRVNGRRFSPHGQLDHARRPGQTDRREKHLVRIRWRPDAATRHVLACGEPVIIPDLLAPSRFGPYPQVAKRGILSFALVPLRAGGRVLGVLSVSFAHPAALTAEDEEILSLFAGHAAAALDRLRLLHAERRRANQMERLAGILACVGAAEDQEQALEALLRGAISLLDGEYGVACLFGATAGEPGLVLRIERDGRLVERSTVLHVQPGSAVGALQAGGVASIVEDFATLDPPSSPPAAPVRQRGVRSAVNVPIVAGGRLIGSLRVYHRLPRYYGSADLAAAEALATHAAAAIERACVEAARRAAADQLAREQEALAARDAETAALQRLDQLKTELLGTISHELRTPLTVIHGYAQRLQVRPETLDAAKVAEIGARIEASSSQLGRLVEQLLDFAHLERGEVPLSLEDFDLVPHLLDSLKSLRLQRGGERLVWQLPARLPVRADRHRVIQVVSNLFENAVKYAPRGPIILRGRPVQRSSGSGQTPRRYVRLEVEDQGPGVAAGQQERIWEKFVRGGLAAHVNAVPGSGIGLAVVKSLVEAQGGRVGVENVPGSGARFWFELPSPDDALGRGAG